MHLNSSSMTRSILTMNDTNFRSHVALHGLYLFYALILVLMKCFNLHFSGNFLLMGFSIILVLLVIYTFFWQKILERFELSYAYLNKSSVLVWSSIFGYIFFGEVIEIKHIIGIIMILIGLFFISTGKNHE